MWLLTVPKCVVITNARLNFVYYALTLATLIVAFWSLSNRSSYLAPVPSETQSYILASSTQIQESITTHRLCPTSNGTILHSRLEMPGGFDTTWMPASSTCLPVCNDGEDGQDRNSCVSSLTQAHHRHSQEVAVWTARHILRSDATHRTVDSRVGLSAAGTEFKITYAYKRLEAMPYLATWFYKNTAGFGTNSNAKTVVLSSDGEYHKEFAPGETVIMSLREVLAVVTDLPDSYGRSNAETVPWEIFRDGIELSLRVRCYTEDSAIQKDSLKFGATNEQPACYLSISYVQCCPDFHMWAARPDHGVVVDRAVLIRTQTDHNDQWYPDFSHVVVGVTSSLVLLGLPSKILRAFALVCLGQLSDMYHRVLLQTFDIAEQTTTMAVLLMSNSVPFLELSDVNCNDTDCPGISRARFEERLKQALQQRRDVWDEHELSAFADCCFKHMHLAKQTPFHRMMMMFSSCCWPAEGSQHLEEKTCDIDTFNVHCSYDSAVDLDTAIRLFDSDRRRGIVERMFTPAGVTDSLVQAKKAREGPKSHVLPTGTQSASDFVSQVALRRRTLEYQKKLAEAKQRKQERDLKELDEKFKQLEGKLCEKADTSSSENLLRETTEHFEGRLQQLERAIEVSETQVQPLWSAVHQALTSMGERVHAFDGRLRDLANAVPPEIDVPSQEFGIFQARQAAHGNVASRTQSRKGDFTLDEWKNLFEDLQNRVVVVESQMKQVNTELMEKHISGGGEAARVAPQTLSGDTQSAGAAPVQRQFADGEERFMAALDMKIGRRIRKIEEDVRQLTKASQTVTPASPDYSRLMSPRSDTRQPSPRPIRSRGDFEDTEGQEARSYSTQRSGKQLAGAIARITAPAQSPRQSGSQPENRDSNRHSRGQDTSLPQSARYQACRLWP